MELAEQKIMASSLKHEEKQKRRWLEGIPILKQMAIWHWNRRVAISLRDWLNLLNKLKILPGQTILQSTNLNQCCLLKRSVCRGGREFD